MSEYVTQENDGSCMPSSTLKEILPSFQQGAYFETSLSMAQVMISPITSQYLGHRKYLPQSVWVLAEKPSPGVETHLITVLSYGDSVFCLGFQGTIRFLSFKLVQSLTQSVHKRHCYIKQACLYFFCVCHAAIKERHLIFSHQDLTQTQWLSSANAFFSSQSE